MPTKNSLFYTELQQFPVPMLALEKYALEINTAATDEQVLDLLEDILVTICGVTSPQENDYKHLLDVFSGVSEIEKQDSKPSRKSFGTSFAKFFSELDVTSLLGLMTNYDLQAMRQLYCKVDVRHLRDLMNTYTQFLMESNTIAFEASLYGQGNSYKDDGKPEAVDANSKEGMAMMRQFGVGSVSSDMLSQLGVELPKL